MDLQIANRKALITGAAGGMGEATARLLLDEGVTPILTDIDGVRLTETVNRLGGGNRITTVVADLTTDEGAEAVKQAAGDIDILVHTAGITGAKGDPVTDVSLDDYREAYETDFLSGVRMAKAFLPGMRKRKWGRAVYVTSENVAQPYSDEAVYNAAKAAVLTFVKGVAQAYAIHGVLVNSVAPAFIATGMTDGMMDKRAKQINDTKENAITTFLNDERPHLVLHRRGRAEEVAAVIALLCSERASFVVGANYRVDGGSVQSINI